MSSDIASQYVGGVRSVVKYMFSRPSRESFQLPESGSILSTEENVENTTEVSYRGNVPQVTYISEATITLIVIVYIFLQFMFSVGAAVQSYIYNRIIGTGDVLTVIYMILCFFFSSFYYPFYTFVLGGGAPTAQRNYNQVAGRRK